MKVFIPGLDDEVEPVVAKALPANQSDFLDVRALNTVINSHKRDLLNGNYNEALLQQMDTENNQRYASTIFTILYNIANKASIVRNTDIAELKKYRDYKKILSKLIFDDK